jgi:hypothetical protein
MCRTFRNYTERNVGNERVVAAHQVEYEIRLTLDAYCRATVYDNSDDYAQITGGRSMKVARGKRLGETLKTRLFSQSVGRALRSVAKVAWKTARAYGASSISGSTSVM